MPKYLLRLSSYPIQAEITTLPVRPAPPSPDRTLALYGYPLDFGDDSSDQDMSYKAAMNRWRAALSSTCHPLLLSEIPSLSSPPSLLTSSSLPPSLLPSSSQTLRASLASAMQEMMTPRARVGSLKQHDMVTRESLRITRGRLTRSQLRSEYAEQEVRELREFWMTDKLEKAELLR
ncbi:hypothetical protein Tco_0652909 [Tanacetum coccineum]|uniref:Uncharacterized protein n=1 Tax=Tanacetum coccineum TaxID=301880 RepID=A0ABQ4WZ33_9ASTR